jgi:hypothetical protein
MSVGEHGDVKNVITCQKGNSTDRAGVRGPRIAGISI